jgi:hypothetical protein
MPDQKANTPVEKGPRLLSKWTAEKLLEMGYFCIGHHTLGIRKLVTAV